METAMVVIVLVLMLGLGSTVTKGLMSMQDVHRRKMRQAEEAEKMAQQLAQATWNELGLAYSRGEIEAAEVQRIMERDHLRFWQQQVSAWKRKAA